MSDKENTSWQELLIELVRASPCLYDKSHPDFFDDRGTKAHCWKRIAEQLSQQSKLEVMPFADSLSPEVLRKYETRAIQKLEDAHPVANLPSLNQGVADLSFSPNGQWLASGGSDGTLPALFFNCRVEEPLLPA